MIPSAPKLCALALLAAGSGALAQQVYRHVDPGGRVVFSDLPPAASPKPAAGRAEASPSAANAAGLPFELRQVMQRYPVTLYTSAECGPCDTGRSLLTTRGVPFDERTISTVQDSEALQRLSGQTSLPLLAIGTQQLKGFSDAEWSQYLDAAGYPKSNLLPPGYRAAPAAPLVALQEAPRAERRPPAPAAPAAPPTAPAAQGPTPSNPAGIRF